MSEFIYVSKEELDPGQWGVCIKYKDGTVIKKIRSDLPKFVQSFVKDVLEDHETGHELDTQKDHWITDELQANWYAFKRHPFSLVMLIVFSVLDPSRWKNYFKRLTNKKLKEEAK